MVIAASSALLLLRVVSAQASGHTRPTAALATDPQFKVIKSADQFRPVFR